MFERRRQFQVLWVVPLRPSYIRDGHARREEGVFAERFINPAPARVAADVNHGRAVDETVVSQPLPGGGNCDQLSPVFRLDFAGHGGPQVVYSPAFVGDRGSYIMDQRNIPR